MESDCKCFLGKLVGDGEIPLSAYGFRKCIPTRVHPKKIMGGAADFTVELTCSRHDLVFLTAQYSDPLLLTDGIG
jgi:hypothetical protein